MVQHRKLSVGWLRTMVLHHQPQQHCLELFSAASSGQLLNSLQGKPKELSKHFINSQLERKLACVQQPKEDPLMQAGCQPQEPVTAALEQP